MMRALPWLVLLAACAQSPSTGSTSDPTGGPEVRAPIPTEQVLQGIQIGEGGDDLPCDVVLLADESAEAEAPFTDLPGVWTEVPFELDGAAGAADVELVVDAIYERTYTTPASGSPVDCEAEPATWVAALWLDVSGGGIHVETPVVATGSVGVADTFWGQASGADLALDEGTFDLFGWRSGDSVVVEVHTNYFYGTPVGSIGP